MQNLEELLKRYEHSWKEYCLKHNITPGVAQISVMGGSKQRTSASSKTLNPKEYRLERLKYIAYQIYKSQAFDDFMLFIKEYSDDLQDIVEEIKNFKEDGE